MIVDSHFNLPHNTTTKFLSLGHWRAILMLFDMSVCGVKFVTAVNIDVHNINDLLLCDQQYLVVCKGGHK